MLSGMLAFDAPYVLVHADGVTHYASGELLRGGADPRRIGPFLVASHRSLRVDYEVSCPELDTAVQAALDAGAHGARMTGGGFGGSAIALADAGAVQRVAGAVRSAFAGRGFTRPASFEVTPAAGADRLR